MDNIKDVIKNVIGQISNNQPEFVDSIEEAWNSILLPKEGGHYKVLGYKDRVLMISVESTTWLYQIKTRHYKNLKQLKEKIPDIESIKYRIGKINEQDEKR